MSSQFLHLAKIIHWLPEFLPSEKPCTEQVQQKFSQGKKKIHKVKKIHSKLYSQFCQVRQLSFPSGNDILSGSWFSLKEKNIFLFKTHALDPV